MMRLLLCETFWEDWKFCKFIIRDILLKLHWWCSFLDFSPLCVPFYPESTLSGKCSRSSKYLIQLFIWDHEQKWCQAMCPYLPQEAQCKYQIKFQIVALSPSSSSSSSSSSCVSLSAQGGTLPKLNCSFISPWWCLWIFQLGHNFVKL